VQTYLKVLSYIYTVYYCKLEAYSKENCSQLIKGADNSDHSMRDFR